ncbi:MAG: glycosyl hydrolase 53 family protein [Lewinellaceae bacterium]|nr:glycosyl hydrolase 53 family protein [Saprospiraceae bacterium]MCB9330732.1 glycosyl hydrolase 53 family protein [Lewinellaceae bacterium]
MKPMYLLLSILLAAFSLQCNSDSTEDPVPSGAFYLGADLSYVNEMQDCGVVYKENGQAKDPFQLFSDNGCQLVRLRLWHSPSWYDTLNLGKRYGDFADVRKSIQRAKSAGMPVLLDFHLSDFWADPGRQLVPAAWLPVVGNLPVLRDSLYNYVYQTLSLLNADGLLPEMVQIGNETNRMILLSPQDNAAGVPINWTRNAALFNSGIAAVRAVEKDSGKKIQVMIHLANPVEARLLMPGFWANGVRDFDLIGLSYYWAWHKPVTIAQTGAIVAELQNSYPGKSVMIVETACIWTTDGNDNANNIINEVHPDYAPASPENQRKWLVDLSREVKRQGGAGVVYWEPAWVSSPCWTPWGQGSHQEHAAFFDFDTNVLVNGGMGWFETKF